MIPNDHAILLFRFSEQRWIDNIIKGELSFSCPGAFIQQAKNTGNNDQGDLYEGIFARLKCNDSKVEDTRKLLGKDLEIIPDGDYVMLRRKSIKKKPIFCLYAYKAGDLLEENKVNNTGRQVLRHNFDKRMFSSFSSSSMSGPVSDSHRFTQITLQPKPFMYQIIVALKKNGHSFESKPVDYELFKEDTFYVEPTDKYDEIFHKFPDYNYQYEGRIFVRDVNLGSIWDRWPLQIGALKPENYKITHEPLSMSFTTDIISI